MAWPLIDFTEEGRYRFAKYLGITHWICIVPSFICLISALYIQLIIEDKISFIESYNGAVLPGVLVFTGSFGFFSHIISGKVIFSNRDVEKREKWAGFLLPVVTVTFVIFLLEFIASIMCYVHISDLGKSLDKGIRSAMLVYNADIVKKEDLDILQMTYECCGSKSYSEWFSVSWINPNSNSQNNDVPFSCCNPAAKRPCIRHRIYDNGYHYNYDYRSGLTIYRRGCATKLMDFYDNSVLTVIGSIIISLSFIQLVSSFACRILQTAIVEAMTGEDPEGPSQGYIFGTSKPKGIDETKTTEESTEVTTTTEDTLEGIPEESQLDDSFEDGYVNIDVSGEATYENIPPSTDKEEHIYNEGDVEEYLAAKFARSREMFEHPPPPPEDVEPIYENVPLLKEVRSNKGSFMTMNTTTNSKLRLPTSSSTPVYRHPLPSPIAHDKSGEHYIIDLTPGRGCVSPLKKRHSSIAHDPYDKTDGRRKSKDSIRIRHPSRISPSKTLRWNHPTIETWKVQPQTRTYPRSFYYGSPTRGMSPPYYGSIQHSLKRSPQRPRDDRTVLKASRVPLLFDGKRSPKKRRSRSNSVSPERKTFKSGSSFGCHHGVAD